MADSQYRKQYEQASRKLGCQNEQWPRMEVKPTPFASFLAAEEADYVRAEEIAKAKKLYVIWRAQRGESTLGGSRSGSKSLKRHLFQVEHVIHVNGPT